MSRRGHRDAVATGACCGTRLETPSRAWRQTAKSTHSNMGGVGKPCCCQCGIRWQGGGFLQQNIIIRRIHHPVPICIDKNNPSGLPCCRTQCRASRTGSCHVLTHADGNLHAPCGGFVAGVDNVCYEIIHLGHLLGVGNKSQHVWNANSYQDYHDTDGNHQLQYRQALGCDSAVAIHPVYASPTGSLVVYTLGIASAPPPVWFRLRPPAPPPFGILHTRVAEPGKD